MKAWVWRNRILIVFLVSVPAVALIADMFDYARHGGLNKWANDCLSGAEETRTNTCEETINFAVCIRGHQREGVVPCYQAGAIPRGASETIRPAPDGIQTVLLACRDPYRPTRAPRQESSLRFGYACGPATTGLRLTE